MSRITGTSVHHTEIQGTNPNIRGGGAASASQAYTSSDAVEDFFKMMVRMVETLTDVFEECKACSRYLSELKTTEANIDRGYKERMIKTWYGQTKPHVADITRRNNDIIMRNVIPFLKHLDFRSKWMDPEIDEQDRSQLWSYVNQLTYLACLHCEVDPKQVQALHFTSQQETKIFKVSEDNIMSFDIRNLADLAKEVKRVGPQLAPMIGPQLAPMMKALVTPGSNSGLQSMISAQRNNFAAEAMKALQQPPQEEQRQVIGCRGGTTTTNINPTIIQHISTSGTAHLNIRHSTSQHPAPTYSTSQRAHIFFPEEVD